MASCPGGCRRLAASASPARLSVGSDPRLRRCGSWPMRRRDTGLLLRGRGPRLRGASASAPPSMVARAAAAAARWAWRRNRDARKRGAVSGRGRRAAATAAAAACMHCAEFIGLPSTRRTSAAAAACWARKWCRSARLMEGPAELRRVARVVSSASKVCAGRKAGVPCCMCAE